MTSTGYSRRGLHGEVVHTLAHEIAGGTWPSGAVLDPASLSARFGVSRTVVREAFKVLTAKGMLESRPRVGTRVTDADAWNLLDPDVLVWRGAHGVSKRDLQEYLELRLAVEPEAASLAAQRAGDEALVAVAAAQDEIAAAVRARDDQAFSAADARLHHTLLAASGNRLFAQLRELIAASLAVQNRVLDVDQEVVEDHGAVTAAVLARDAAGAREAMTRLLRVGMHNVDRALPEDDLP